MFFSHFMLFPTFLEKNNLGIQSNYFSLNVFFMFLAPLCHLAAELFKCRFVVVVVVVGGVNFKGGGGKGQSQKRFSNLLSF